MHAMNLAGLRLSCCLLSLPLLASACGSDPADLIPDLPDAGQVPDTSVDATTAPDSSSQPDVPTPAPDVRPPADVEPPDGGPVVPNPPVRSCESNADCDDGITCTRDTCSDAGQCVWTLNAGTCLLNGRCVEDGAPSARNSCQVCDAFLDPFGLTTLADGVSCDDGSACTILDVCTEGVCAGAALECEDNNPCTADSCDPSAGCTFSPVRDGTACDDGSACTTDTMCMVGVCRGTRVSCDDGNPCTDDTCDPASGCVSINNTRPCSDGNACTEGDVCSEGSCVAGPSLECDDGNQCTIDLCDEFAGCAYLPLQSPCCLGSASICDDGNPCTTDLCDPETLGCDYENNTVVCSDGNVCTAGDRCAEGGCVPGPPLNCDDGNACTTNACRPGSGAGAGCAATALNNVPCDNGDACTTGDTCRSGVCEPGTLICACEPAVGRDAVLLTRVAIGAGGRPGQALNVDGNAITCAPADNCEGGLDNALALLAGFANEPLQVAIDEGDINLMLDIDDISRNPFRVAVHTADADPVEEGCVATSGLCRFLYSRRLFTEACQPVVALPANRTGSAVLAGGGNSVLPLEIPFGEGAVLRLTVYRVRFEGSVTLTDGRVTGLQGIIGGAVRKSELLQTINDLPADALPIDRGAISNLLNLAVQNDIDTNGDGTLDGASIGLPVTGVRAVVTGVLPVED
jgi:hypothetical protein